MRISDRVTLLACLLLSFDRTAVAAEPPMATVGGVSQAPEATSAPAALGSTLSASSVPPELAALLRGLYPEGIILSHDASGVTLRDAGRERLIAWGDLPSQFAPEGRGRSAPPAAWRTPAPGYPFQARKERVTGTLVLLVRTDAEGRVVASAIAVPLHPALDAHVQQFVREHWTGPAEAHRTVELAYRLVD